MRIKAKKIIQPISVFLFAVFLLVILLKWVSIYLHQFYQLNMKTRQILLISVYILATSISMIHTLKYQILIKKKSPFLNFLTIVIYIHMTTSYFFQFAKEKKLDEKCLFILLCQYFVQKYCVWIVPQYVLDLSVCDVNLENMHHQNSFDRVNEPIL